MVRESYSEFIKRRDEEEDRLLRSTGVPGATPEGRFYNRFENEPQNRREKREQSRAALDLAKKGINEDVETYDHLSREAANEAASYRKMERQAEENWRFMPSDLVKKQVQSGQFPYCSVDVEGLKNDVQNRRRLAEDDCQDYESYGRFARDKRDHYETRRKHQHKTEAKGVFFGGATGEGVSLATGGADFGVIAAAGSMVGGGISKAIHERRNQKEAYNQMNAARQSFKSAGYRPGKYY